MANEITKVNGVTKNKFLTYINYDFPTAYITVNTDLATYTLIPKNNPQNQQTVLYSDITDKLGSSDMETYVDALANLQFFFDSTYNPFERTFYNEQVVAMRHPIIERKSSYPISNLRDIITLNGSATFTKVVGEYRLNLTASGTDNGEVKTADIGRYMAHSDANTGIAVRVPTLPTGNQFIEWGIDDGTDAFLWGVDATGVYIKYIRNGVQISKTYSNNWSNESGFVSSLDLTVGYVYNIDYAHYGFGPAKFTIVDENSAIEYKKYVVHRLEYDGGVSLTNPNLPILLRADNNGSATALDVYIGGRQFSIDGMYQAVHRINSQSHAFSAIGTTPTLLFSVRKKSGFQNINVKVSEFHVTPNDFTYFWIVKNNTLTGASWGNITNQQVGETALELDTTASDALDGIVIGHGHGVGANKNQQQFTQTLNNVLSYQQPISVYVNAAPSATGNITGEVTLDLLEEW